MKSLFFKKSIIAITGLFLCALLIVHLSVNFILLLPEPIAREAYNSYSTTLRDSFFIKIIAYILYLSLILHTIYALIVTLKNRKAKSKKYNDNRANETSSWSSQNMDLLGSALLLFIVFHLANFWARIKLGIGEEVGINSNRNKDVYEVTYSLFQNICYVIFYSVLMIPLAFHIHHSFKSAFKSLGFYHKKKTTYYSKNIFTICHYNRSRFWTYSFYCLFQIIF